MGVLSSFKTYWATNSTLNTAIPSVNLYLDWVPPGPAFPYVQFTALTSVPTLTTGHPQIETFSYQLTIFHNNLDTLSSLTDTVTGQLDQAYLTAATLINTRRSKRFMGEVVNGTYVYSAILSYDWSMNTSV